MPLSKKEFAELIREVGPERAVEEAHKRELTAPVTLDGKQIGRGVYERVGEIGKSIKDIPAALSSLVAPKSVMGDPKAPSRIDPSDVINAFLPYKEALKQAQGGDVSGALGRFSTDAVLAAAPFASVGKTAQGATEGANVLRGSRAAAIGKFRSPLPVLSDAQMAEETLAALKQGPGATINRSAGNLAGKPRYAVGKYPSRNVRIEGRQLTPDDITSFIKANSDVLAHPDNSLGVWSLPGKPIDLDVTGTPAKLSEALKIGQRRGTGLKPEEAVYDLRFANEKNPALGNVKVRPNLPPSINALLESQRGEVRIPREWVPVGGTDSTPPVAPGKTVTPSSLEDETYQRMMGKIARNEPTVSAEAKHQFEARQNVDRRRQAEALQRGEVSQRVAPTDRRSPSVEHLDIPGITAESAPIGRGSSMGPSGLEHPSSAQGSLDFAPQELYQILEHRSAQPNLTEVDPSKYGTGFAGAELKRKQNYPAEFKDRSYYTLKGGEVENKFKGLPTYETSPVSKEKIYDFGTDPLGLDAEAAKVAHGDPSLVATLREAMAQQRGYLGFMNSAHDHPAMRSAVALFEKQPVRRVK